MEKPSWPRMWIRPKCLGSSDRPRIFFNTVPPAITLGAEPAMALMNTIGLVCDPVGGFVEVPCVSRNAFYSARAVSAAQLARAGLTGRHVECLSHEVGIPARSHGEWHGEICGVVTRVAMRAFSANEGGDFEPRSFSEQLLD